MLITIPEDVMSGRSLYHQPLNHSISAPIRRNNEDSLRKTRLIRLQRSSTNSYGFHLRGGREHATGFFISHVDVGSEAYSKGLRTGDQVIKVNNYSISRCLHREVASIVQSSNDVLLEVKSTGIIPVQKNVHEPLSWVPVNKTETQRRDSSGSQPYSLKSMSSSNSSCSSLSSTPLFIVMSGAGKSTIGCSICKGPAEKPGIFVQKIIDKGLAEEAGLRPGDQILSCNGRSFINIEFQQAVHQMKSAPCLRLEVLRGAGMELVTAESSGYNSSVSSEEEENYPSSESDSYRDVYSDAYQNSSRSDRSSFFLDSNRDWKEIEAEWADAEVSEKKTKCHRSTLPSRQLPPSKSLLSLTIREDECEHGVSSIKNKRNYLRNELSLPKQHVFTKMSNAKSLSDLTSAANDTNFKIALQTTTEAHVSKIVIPSIPKNEKNALMRLEQLSSPNSTLKGTLTYNPPATLRNDPETSLSSISSVSTDDSRTKQHFHGPKPVHKPDDKPHLRLQRTSNIAKIDPQQLIKAPRVSRDKYVARECQQLSSEDSDSIGHYPSSKILITSENGKFTSKVIIRSAPPAPPPRANNTKLSRNHRNLRCSHRPFLRSGSNPLTTMSQVEFLTPPASPSISSGSSNDYYACSRSFQRHKSFGSLSASSDESGAWEDSSDPYISHCAIQVPSEGPTLARDIQSGANPNIPSPPPPPPPALKTTASNAGLPIPPPPPPPPCPTQAGSPVALGAALSKEIQSRQEQEGNGLRKVRNNNIERKPPVEDPKKHQHDKLMEEFRKAHAMMFNKKNNTENIETTVAS